MALKLVTPPAEEPITLAEAKAHLRVDGALEDSMINGLITAARLQAEIFTRRALITQTWDLILDAFPEVDEIKLPLPPLQSVSSVTYKDSAGNPIVFGASNYVVGTQGEPGRVKLASGASWAADELYPLEAVTVKFVAGHGAAAAVPQLIKQGMLLLIGHLFENREQVVIGPNAIQLPMGVEYLWWNYRFNLFGGLTK